MTDIVYLNGPPGCGKDTLVSQLVPYLRFRHLKFAAPLKRAVAGLLDVTMSEIEARKDQPLRMFNEDTIRKVLIRMSEEFLKPTYSADIFGKLFWQDAKNSAVNLIIASDCGFFEEVERVIYNNSKEKCLLIRIHRTGCDFTDDSRSYLPDGMCDTVDIDNNGTLNWLTMFGIRVIMKKFPVEFVKEPEWLKL